MARTSRKKRTRSSAPSDAPSNRLKFSLRAGMPALDSIIAVRPLAPALTAAADVAIAKYRIIVTNEVDAYEQGATPQEELSVTAAAVAAAPAGDKFTGTARKAAKLSIGTGKIEEFADLKDLIEALPEEEEMIFHKPPIKTTSTSGRVKEEQRNVRVRAFIYAASRENDNDFHLIIGRDPNDTPEMYMTMELSGLPTSNSKSFKKLKAARDAYKEFFQDNLPGTRYEFPDPPVPVEIEGSLFFDMSHSSGSRPGPKSLKSRMPTIWEVHPITKMVFEP